MIEWEEAREKYGHGVLTPANGNAADAMLADAIQFELSMQELVGRLVAIRAKALARSTEAITKQVE